MTGDTMSGDLHIAKATPQMFLDKAASGQGTYIYSTLNGVIRWRLDYGNAAAEGGVGV